jgi:hypothetical protein
LGNEMPINTIVSALLITLAAAAPLPDQQGSVRQSKAEKAAVVQRVINHATDCVVREIRAAPSAADLGEQIVAVMPSCADTMRSLIEAFDANYGEGTGETFFSGSFLDILPQVVSKRLSQSEK